MITFIPHEDYVESPLSTPEPWVNNIANNKMAEKLTSMFGEKTCEKHPEYKNRFVVNLNKGEGFLELTDFCCEEFKQTLDLLSQNKNPFVTKE